VAVLALVAALLAGGGAAAIVLPGLTDSGAFTRWGLPLATLVLDGAATVTVGLLLLAVLLPSRTDELHPDALRALRLASRWAALWALAALVVLLLTFSDLLGTRDRPTSWWCCSRSRSWWPRASPCARGARWRC
jgi:putative copper resistance protein D